MKFENELKAERPHCNMLLPCPKKSKHTCYLSNLVLLDTNLDSHHTHTDFCAGLLGKWMWTCVRLFSNKLWDMGSGWFWHLHRLQSMPKSSSIGQWSIIYASF